MAIILTHKMAAPCGQRWLPPCRHKMAAIRWPAGKGSWEGSGLQGRTVVGDQASRGGQREGPGLQKRAVGGNQTCRGQLRVTRLAGEDS